jgi:hypothetical protein
LAFGLFCGVACSRSTGAGRWVVVVTREGTFRVTNPESITAETILAPITICSPEQKV